MIFGEEKFIHAWRTPPGFWQRYVIPPPANTEHLPTENVWHGIRYTSPSPEDIAARIKAEAEAAAAKAAAEKEAEAKPRKKAASPRKQRRL
jgi:hypothetical protein